MSGEEQQNVSFITLAHVDLDHGAYGRLQVVPLRLGRVEDLHGVRAARDGEERAAVEVHLELPGVQRGAHDDHLDGQRDNVLVIGGGEERDKKPQKV